MDQTVGKKFPSKPEGDEKTLSVAVSFYYKWTQTLEYEFDEVLCYLNSGKWDRDTNILLPTKGLRRISALRKTTLIFFKLIIFQRLLS